MLGRAVCVAVPAGFLIWILANCNVNGFSVLHYVAGFFDPLGRIMGLDGYILTAFVFGIPANEIVLPILLMMYLQSGVLVGIDDFSKIGEILVQNGWTVLTAVNVMIFTLLHFPCMTTLLTIKKETGGWKWMWVSLMVPTVLGIVVCVLVRCLFVVVC